MDKRVNIFLIGSRKSGTTSLANFLDGHSEISLSTIKESNYWDTNAIESIGSIDEYHNLFDWNTPHQLDASTNYTTYPICAEDVAARMHKYNPDAKIIYLIRNPIDRIISHYKMSYERGDLIGTLDEAIINHPLLIACSKYHTQIQRYIKLYPIDQILLLDNKELNGAETEAKLKSFLGLQNDFKVIIKRDNSAVSDYRMPRKFDSILNNAFFSFVKKILPNTTIKYVKRKLFISMNEAKDISMNDKSLSILRKELYTEIDHLQTLVDFDIKDWKNF